MRNALLVGLIVAWAPTLSAADNPPQRTSGFDVAVVRLLQPDFLFGQRSNAQELSVTIKAVETPLSAYAAGQPNPDFIDSCVAYIAIRANRRLKTWTQCEGNDRREIDAFMAANVGPEKIASVSQGSLIFSIHGYDSNPSNLDVRLTPSEWQNAAKKSNLPEGSGLEMEQLVDLAWPK